MRKCKRQWTLKLLSLVEKNIDEELKQPNKQRKVVCGCTTKKGTPCQAQAARSTGICSFHIPYTNSLYNDKDDGDDEDDGDKALKAHVQCLAHIPQPPMEALN